MGGWINDLVTTLLGAVLAGITTAVQAGLNWILAVLGSSLFASPDVTVLPQVQYASGRAQLVANAGMGLTVTVAGGLAMTHGSLQDRHSLKELLPRMLIAFTAANFAVPIVRAAITLANAVTVALVGAPLDSGDSFTAIRRIVLGTSIRRDLSMWVLILQVLALVMLVMVEITWLGRLAGLLVVAGIGPLALAAHALPHTDPVARLWWRSLGGLLAVQVLQALTLHLAVATLLTSGANLPALGLPVDPTGVLNLLITCYLLWLVIRIPRWVARTIGGTGGRSGILGYVVRIVLVQRLLGAVGLRGGHRHRGATPGQATPRPGGSGPRRGTGGPGGGGGGGWGGGAGHPYPRSPAGGRSHPQAHRSPGRPVPGRAGAGALPAPAGPPGHAAAALPWGPPSGTRWQSAPPAPARPGAGAAGPAASGPTGPRAASAGPGGLRPGRPGSPGARSGGTGSGVGRVR